jgi:predicted RNA binding protein YcfA (HicA-like mRNA interferase family)
VSSRLPRVTGQEVLRALERGGFQLMRIRGSHHYLRRPGGRLVTVPVHAGETLSLTTLASILDQADLSATELIELL